MATATLELRADSRQVRTATRDLRSLERQGEGTERIVNGIRNAFVALGSAAVIGQAIKTTADFSQAVANLSAITGATGRDLQFYRDQAAEIGRTTTLSASQAVEAYQLIASASPQLLSNAEALNAVTREAVTLAEATGQDLPTAAKALGSALNQFQLDANRAGEVINILAASSQLGTAQVGQVTEALRNAGPAAQALNIDLAETVAGIQALAAAGREGSDAGTALRQVMLRLERTGDAALQPSVAGLTNALAELESRNLSNTELMKLFGDEAFSAATAILGQRDTLERLNDTLRGTETAYEQASTRTDTFSGDLKALQSAVEGLQLEALSDNVNGFARQALQAATGGVNALTQEVGFLDQAFQDSASSAEFIAKGIAIIGDISRGLVQTYTALRIGFLEAQKAAFEFGAALESEFQDVARSAAESVNEIIKAYNALPLSDIDLIAVDAEERAGRYQTKINSLGIEISEARFQLNTLANEPLPTDRVDEYFSSFENGKQKVKEAYGNILNLKQIPLEGDGNTSDMNQGGEAQLPQWLVDQLDQEREYYDNSKALAQEAADFIIEQEQRKKDQTVELANARLRAEQSVQSQSLSLAQNVFGSIAQTVAEAKGKESDAYKAAFLAQQAAAIAMAYINTESAAVAAIAPPPVGLGPVAGAPYAATVRGLGYASIGVMAAQTFMELGGARRQGGQVIGGQSYLVGEDGPEVVNMGGNGRVTPFNQLMKEAGGAQSTPNFKTEIYNMANGVEVKSKQPRWSNEDKAWVLGVVVESLDQRRDVFKGIERNTTATGKAR